MGPLSTTRRVLAAIAGILAFVILNFLMLLDRCTVNEFMVNCNAGGGRHTAFVLFVIAVLVGIALMSRTGRLFSLGFAGGLILMATLTAGACTPSWTDPYTTYRIKTAPAREARARAARQDAKLAAWLGRVNSRPMEVFRGVDIARDVAHCVRYFALRNGGRFPVSDAEMMPCETMSRMSESGDKQQLSRYLLPDDPPRPEILGLPTTPRQGDAGWRVRYELTPGTDYTITVLPDEQLTHRWPRIYLHGTGRLEVQRDDASTRLEISPVKDLILMTQCLKGMPQEDERRMQRGLSGSLRLTQRLRRVCPPLVDRVRELIPAHDLRTFLGVSAPVGPGGAQELVAGWVVEYVQRRNNEPYNYDLLAHPAPGGLTYVVGMDGEVRPSVAPLRVTADNQIVPQ